MRPQWIGGKPRCKLGGLLSEPRVRGSIGEKLRAEVLRHPRCAQRGKTPTEDNVKLQVDHKLPSSWRGTEDPASLQALCF